MPRRFEGAAALVTGAASGIGRGVVEALVDEGARVCALDISPDGLAELEKRFSGQVVTVEGDVCAPETHRRAVAAVESELGKLDVLIANAGIFDGYADLGDMTGDQLSATFDEIFAVNVKGYLLAAQATAPFLTRGGGSMVFTVSVSAFHSETGGCIYSASKAAVVGVIRQLAYDLAPAVRVNGVSPGGTQTGLRVAAALRDVRTAPRRSGGDEEAALRRARRRSPLGHRAVAADHVPAYLFLASDDSKLMTGTVLHSDGGLGARGIEQIHAGFTE